MGGACGPVPLVPSSLRSSRVKVTTTNLPTANASAVICAENADRIGFIIWNNSANSCYIGLSSVAVAATCCKIIATFTSWEWLQPTSYTGIISAIRNAGSGTITVWEILTP